MKRLILATMVIGGSLLVTSYHLTPVNGTPSQTIETAITRATGYDRSTFKLKYQRPLQVPYPKDNPPSPEKELLGKMLFFDPRLSGTDGIACASCHNPSFSWGDGRALAVGHDGKQLAKRTPTILNTAYAELLFWDGRAGSLEEQALGPITSPGEMNLPLDQLPGKVAGIAGYRPLFARAFPGEDITAGNIARAIATYERSVISAKAPFDAWVEGQENAISEAAKRGFDLFNTTANCVQCHAGWNFSDDGFHDIGIPGEDLGRGKYLPQIEVIQHAFKTPTLRNADQRAPFMHDGSERTLEEVVEFYVRGGKVKRPSLSPEMKPLNLSAQEKHDLCTFVRCLTSEDRPVEMPKLPR